MANERLYEDMEPREKFDALWLKAGLHKRPGADALLYDLEKQGFFDLPASIKHHSNRFGGLVTHTVNVADFDRRVASIKGLLAHTQSASLRGRLNLIYRDTMQKYGRQTGPETDIWKGTYEEKKLARSVRKAA